MNLKKIEKKILITNKLGLHARAAAKFVNLTSKCSSKFLVKKGKNSVNGSSILGLMTLAASKGTEIQVQCIGNKAEEDLNKLVDLIKNNFGEEKPLPENLNKEKIYEGIGVSHGFAIGYVEIKHSSALNYSRYNIPISGIKNEIKRFEKAVKKSILDLKNIIKKIRGSKNNIYEEMKFMLEANVSILTSSSLIKDAKKRIEKDLVNAELAINEELNKHSKQFSKISDHYLRDRFDDVRHVCGRILDNLQKIKKKKKTLFKNKILVASEFSPADLLSDFKTQISGLVSVFGGPEGHFAIVARSLSIATVVGIKDIVKNLNNDELIIVDGEKGRIIQNPSKVTMQYYQNKIEEQKNLDKKLNLFKDFVPFTKDKLRIKIEANVDNSQEVKESMKKGIDGIGLFRSEYLFMNKKTLPTEDEQFKLIKKSLLYLEGKTLTIRTLDIGNDKQVPSMEKILSKSPNPALGLRAVRLALAFPKIFKKQISAILRASKYGKIRIMLPMVSNVNEIEESKKLINEVRDGLIKKGVKISEKNPELGILIETPAAALISEQLSKKCDFFAIGSNDLTMYTLAIDRGDEEVAKIYDPTHLSVLKLIKLTCNSAKKAKIPISVCGEMAGDTIFTSLLIGMGIKTLSMSSSRILRVKQFISKIDSADAKKISEDILNEEDNVLIKEKLKNYNMKVRKLIFNN
ncbi:MAG: phosphoenolpyruvate--protein phosphotransferase [Rickettsiales bacterium]|nr:phosphoenolpyruvate--protein phosphotransferase [Rickettsiales bacterium]